MAEQRKSRARKPKQESPPPPPNEEADSPAAVIIAMTEQPDGSVVPQIAVQGGVKVTEVATILELAVIRWRAELGLT